MKTKKILGQIISFGYQVTNAFGVDYFLYHIHAPLLANSESKRKKHASNML